MNIRPAPFAGKNTGHQTRRDAGARSHTLSIPPDRPKSPEKAWAGQERA